MDTNNLVQTILVYALPVLFAITVHEAAHGYVARALGDNTAWMLGRVTLNPLRHIDPMGTVIMPLLLLFTTAALPGGPFLLGYAKPVPVSFGKLRRPKRDMVWVALAGPGSNFIQALLWALLFVGLQAAGVYEPFFLGMAKAGIQVNLALAVFNLFPIPPLDGGRVMVGLLPMRAAIALSRVEPFGFFIVLALVVAHVLDALWMQPLMHVAYGVLNLLIGPLLAAVR
ncbi:MULTISPECIES: site-2 protease family protein [Ramlibacter]|uniref:Site-2 protease family protein n=1 Tax=Ramlibacter aquaticus TaxID=2780094 RepID=A0ABR9SC09_9BURK|nr:MULTISPECIES: site-2 protease family protein [Ramlibacter]MBE7939882.1 site-2 protease family protein [Ramlibacter aquaticus]